MDPRSYDRLVQKSFFTSISKSQKKHLDTVQRKEKLVKEAKQLRKLAYSVYDIARKLQKNPRTIKRYLTQEVIPVSKAYGSKEEAVFSSPVIRR